MYCKQDYANFFLKIDLYPFTYRQIVDLFTRSIRHDSMKIATQIYLRYLCKHNMST